MSKITRIIGIALVVVIILLGGLYLFSDLFKPKTAVNTIVEQANQNITVSIEVGEKIETVNLQSGTTAFQFMQTLKDEGKVTFSGTDYPDMGFFIEEINGVKNDAIKQMYWMYYINDQAATEGISTYILKEGDKITWKYERSNF